MPPLYHRIREKITQRFLLFLNKRMPSSDQQTLSQKNIFILPTRFGFSFICFVLLLFILGTNYQNNLILFISYLLSSIFVTAMLYCFFNMTGLMVSAKGKYQDFCHETLYVPIIFMSSTERFGFDCYFQEEHSIRVETINGKIKVNVPVLYSTRGQYQLGRLTIASEYLLGLFRCWTHLQFDLELTIYPQPLACELVTSSNHPQQVDEQSNNELPSNIQGDDFYELRSYRAGDALNHVAWKQLAKSGVWLTKHNQQVLSDKVFLSLADMPAIELEKQLQQLCYLILQCHQQGQEYGLDLAGEKISPAQGDKHLTQCLTALSVYE